jgi:hypothetical protein
MEHRMKLKHLAMAVLGTLALGVVATASQAAPAGSVTANLKVAAGKMSSVQDVRRHRHCRHHRHSRRHCWWD